MTSSKPDCFGEEHTGACDDCHWFTACAEATAVPLEDDICGQCNGSGEGQYDGTRCYRCKGRGTVCGGEE